MVIRTAPEDGPPMGLARLAPFLLRPINVMLPIDHQMAYKSAVGAAKGSGPLRQHVARLLETWILVGALNIGVTLTMLSFVRTSQWGSSATEEAVQEQIFDWVCWAYTVSCYSACITALSGPIVLNAVLVTNTLACSDENFDLLLEAAKYVFLYADVLTAMMCYSLASALLLLPFIVLNHLLTASILSGLCVITLMATVYSINLVSTLTVYGGLLSANRPCNARPWNFRSKRDGREMHVKVVDALVRKSLRNINCKEGVLAAYSHQRMGTQTRGLVSELAERSVSVREEPTTGIAQVIRKHGGARGAASHLTRSGSAYGHSEEPDEELAVEELGDEHISRPDLQRSTSKLNTMRIMARSLLWRHVGGS